MTVLEMTLKILQVMGRPDLEPVILNQAKDEIRHQYLDVQKAKRRLNWAPRYSLEKGLVETISWYQQFLSVARHNSGSPRVPKRQSSQFF